MQEITEQLFAGADKPMQEAARKLPAEMGKVADKVLDEARRMADVQQYFNRRLSDSGLRAQTAALAGVTDMSGPLYVPVVEATRTSPEQAGTINLQVIVENMNVRDETDIQLISREFYNLTKAELRTRGVR